MARLQILIVVALLTVAVGNTEASRRPMTANRRPVSSRPITATTTKFDQKGACRSNPCQNGGTCQLVANNTTSFKCICPDLIYGETCSDLCRSNSAEGINGMEGRGMELFQNFVGKYYVKPGTDAFNLPPGAKVSIFLFHFN